MAPSSFSPDTPLLPQLYRRPLWTGYSQEELRAAEHLWSAEVYTLPIIAVVYWLLCWYSASDAQLLPSSPLLVTAMEWLCMLVTLHVMYFSVFCMVYPTANQVDLFRVTSGPFGRYIFLTRQTLAVQAIHFVTSVIAPSLSLRLALGTYAMAVPVGGLCVFVTLQFFILARPTIEHRDDCRLWATRGVHYAFASDYIHVPAGVIAVLEACVLRQREMFFLQTPSLLNILLSYAGFVVYYVGLIHVNHAITGHWPYGFLKALGMDVGRWAKFLFTQFMVLSAFVMIPWILPQIVPAVW